MAVMKLQSEHNWCGACATANALLAIGIERSEGEIAALAKTSAWDGTGAKGIIEALRKVGVTPGVVQEAREDVFALKVDKALSDGHSIVACISTDKPWDHWVALVGRLGGFITVADPARGTLSVPQTTFFDQARGDGRRPYYAIILL